MRDQRRPTRWVDLTLVAPVREDQSTGEVLAKLRERLAVTADRVAATFELSAKVRERMAARGGAAAEYHRMRGEQHRRIAEFERRQAQALREGYLLETPPHLGADIPPQRW